MVPPDDYNSFSVLINRQVPLGASTIKTQCRLRHKGEEEYYWHPFSISPLNDKAGKLLSWIGYLVDSNAGAGHLPEDRGPARRHKSQQPGG